MRRVRIKSVVSFLGNIFKNESLHTQTKPIHSKKMNVPPLSDIQDVNIHTLIPGERYYAVSVNSWNRYRRIPSVFKGTFTEYFTNDSGYKLLRFHNTTYVEGDIVSYTGSPVENPLGLWWRVWEDHLCPQSYKYYPVSRFTPQQKKEIYTRYTLRMRRQYERGLTGSTPNNLWFPRDLVRELSLKYLTDSTVGCAGRWR